MHSIVLHPPPGPLAHRVAVPGSKSITNRALLAAALATGAGTIRNALQSDDTRYMTAALAEVGIPIHLAQEGTEIRVEGKGGRLGPAAAPLFVGNAGTAMRFLAAALTLGTGEYTLDGIARMRERPIAELVTALRALGGTVDCLEKEGHPPLRIRGGSFRGGHASFSGAVSSQYISAVMLTAPYGRETTEIRIDNPPVSLPYLQMTRSLMEDYGVALDAAADWRRITIPAGGRYRGRDYTVESDASSASYFFAAAAVAGGAVTVENISRLSIQGDIAFLGVLERMGCQVTERDNAVTVGRTGPLAGIDIDMRDISDTAPTLAVTALFAEGPTRIRGVANMRLKETDRISALCRELGKLGAGVREHEDGLTITPAAHYRPAAIDTYDDHRMAMSFALAGLVIPGIEIRNPDCTAKTFPGFFKKFAPLTGGIH